MKYTLEQRGDDWFAGLQEGKAMYAVRIAAPDAAAAFANAIPLLERHRLDWQRANRKFG